ncbi:esterase [Desulfosarcina ovata subsp. sediminis]|uniref:Esterase n=1 Tax=Desulfosarcina ovata subsp. sediminis TaxID=885957 RepID=A0A5K7ZZR8_9BACT|nr:serine hydrolase domain-containing protein [Desulfosarcina ovata]BBO85641.1 esterase [Desulfosarcina ovata subsp. sediminis]
MIFDSVNDLMEQALRDRIFPGAVLLVGRSGYPVLFKAYGLANRFTGEAMTRRTVFDLASLTKPMATTLAVARLVDTGAIALDQTVGTILPELACSDKAAITPRQLLCHQSGLPAHRLFYMMMKSISPKMRKAAVLELLKTVPLSAPPGTATLYSDLGFMLLCRLVERVAGCPMDRFLADRVYGPMGIGDLFFIDLFSGTRSDRTFAATELCPVRNRLLVGEVHDDNAWAVGGIDGQAGLFGTAEAVFDLLCRLANGLCGVPDDAIFSRQMLGQMLYGETQSGFTLGFDRPAVAGSSAGCHFSADTIGHLGFTGTSFWMDLKQDVTVILLTNRVHPFRWNNRLRQFRPMIHDRIMEQIGIQSN